MLSEKDLDILTRKINNKYSSPENNGGLFNWLNKNIASPFGIGASSMLNNLVFGGIGAGVPGLIGAGYDKITGNNNPDNVMPQIDWNSYQSPHMTHTGYAYMPDFQPQDNIFTKTAKSSLEVQNSIDDFIKSWKNDTVGDEPNFLQETLEGTGSSLGFMAAALTLPHAPLLGAALAGTSEALSETGGFLGDAYKNNKYDEALPIAGKNFLANSALNTALEYGAGWFSPLHKKITDKLGVDNGLTRFISRAIGEQINENLQEPSQHVIEDASNKTLYGDGSFTGNLFDSAGNWLDYAGQLAPSVSASTLLTTLLTGGAGAVNLNLQKNNYLNNLQNQIDNIKINDENLSLEDYISGNNQDVANYQNLQDKINNVKNLPLWDFENFINSEFNENSSNNINNNPNLNLNDNSALDYFNADQNLNYEFATDNDFLNNNIQPKQNNLFSNNLFALDQNVLDNGINEIFKYRNTENPTVEDFPTISNNTDFNMLENVNEALNSNNRETQRSRLKLLSHNNINRIMSRFFGISPKQGKSMSYEQKVEAILNAWDYKQTDFNHLQQLLDEQKELERQNQLNPYNNPDNQADSVINSVQNNTAENTFNNNETEQIQNPENNENNEIEEPKNPFYPFSSGNGNNNFNFKFVTMPDFDLNDFLKLEVRPPSQLAPADLLDRHYEDPEIIDAEYSDAKALKAPYTNKNKALDTRFKNKKAFEISQPPKALEQGRIPEINNLPRVNNNDYIEVPPKVISVNEKPIIDNNLYSVQRENLINGTKEIFNAKSNKYNKSLWFGNTFMSENDKLLNKAVDILANNNTRKTREADLKHADYKTLKFLSNLLGIEVKKNKSISAPTRINAILNAFETAENFIYNNNNSENTAEINKNNGINEDNRSNETNEANEANGINEINEANEIAENEKILVNDRYNAENETEFKNEPENTSSIKPEQEQQEQAKQEQAKQEQEQQENQEINDVNSIFRNINTRDLHAEENYAWHLGKLNYDAKQIAGQVEDERYNKAYEERQKQHREKELRKEAENPLYSVKLFYNNYEDRVFRKQSKVTKEILGKILNSKIGTRIEAVFENSTLNEEYEVDAYDSGGKYLRDLNPDGYSKGLDTRDIDRIFGDAKEIFIKTPKNRNKLNYWGNEQNKKENINEIPNTETNTETNNEISNETNNEQTIASQNEQADISENNEIQGENQDKSEIDIQNNISQKISQLNNPEYDKNTADHTAQIITQALKTFASYSGESLEQTYNSANLNFENLETDSNFKGFLRITEQGHHFIYLTQHADKSTILHESAHMFLDMYRTLAENNLNNSKFVQDWNAVKKWLGVSDKDLYNDNWTTAQERFARGFEKYIMSGKAPSSKLVRAFSLFKNWLKNIYGAISNIKYTDSKTDEKIAFNLSKGARTIYDNLLTRGEENNNNIKQNEHERIYHQINLDPDAPKSKGVTNYKSLVEKNEMRQKAFENLMFDYQSKFGGKIKFKGVLDRSKISDIARDVYNGDYSRITDYLSATFTFDDNNKILEAAKILTNDEKNITAVRNTLNNGDNTGYKQFVASVKLPHGTIGEIVLQHRAVQDVHDKIGKRIENNINRLNKIDGMNDIVEKLQNFSKKLYDSAINNTFDQLQDNIINKIADNTKKLTRAKTHEDLSQIVNNLVSYTDFNLKEAEYLKKNFDPYFAPDNSDEKNLNEGTTEDFAKHIQDSPNVNIHNAIKITRNNLKDKKTMREERIKNIWHKWHKAFNNQEPSFKESAPEPVQERPNLKFLSDETESRYNKAKNYKQNLFSKVKEAVKEFKAGFSDSNPELANDDYFTAANNALKDLGRKKSLAINNGLESFKQNLNGLDEYELELFGRARMLSDLNFRIHDKPDAKLPFGFTKESLMNEYTRFLKYLDKNQNVKHAIQLEEKTMQDISDKFIKTASNLGLQLDGIFKNPHYYRHIIIDFANSGRYLNGKNSLNQQQIRDLYDYEIGQILNRDYFKKYKGSERDYISNYILANAGVRGQLLADIETMNTLIELKKKYDKMPVTLQQLKQLKHNDNLSNKQNEGSQIYFQDDDNDSSVFDYIPEGYSIFDPASIVHSAKNQTTSAIYEYFNNLSQEKDSLPISEIINTIENIDIKQAQGKMLLPTQLVNSLKHLNPATNNNPVFKLARNITKSWKWWATVSPFRAFRFNIRNFSGDLDAVIAGGMFSAKKFARAVNELRKFYKNGSTSEDLADYIALSGGLNIVSLEHEDIGLKSKALRTLQNLSNKISQNKDMSKFQKLWHDAKQPFTNFNNWIEDRTEEREHWLRYATYLNYKEQIENNNGKPLTYGTSIKSEVDNYLHPEQKAFRLATDLLGDYENISQTGKDLRKVLVPFYSWIEINAKRYWRLFKNGFSGDNSGKIMKALLMGKSAKLPFYAVNFAGTLAKISLLTALAHAFNRTVMPDDDDELPPEVKYRPHITLGRVGDKVLYFDRIGALLDAADWIALDSFFYDAPQIKNGQKSLYDYSKQIISAPFSKALNSLNPLLTVPMELATKRTIYPDATKPRTISERDDYIANTFGVRNEYRALTGKPGPDYFSGDRIAKYFAYTVEPNEAAYFYMLDKVRQFQESVLDKHFDGFVSTKRGNALKNLKTSIRYNDKKNIKFYMQKYREAGGEDKNLKQSMKMMHPLSSLNQEERKKFLNWINAEDRAYLRKAEKFYSKNYGALAK